MPYYGDGAPYYYGSPFSNHSSLMSNVGRYYSPIAARYSPHLSTISESPSFAHRRRHGPTVTASTSSTSTTSSFGRPRRIIDTADIDVSKPPRSYGQDHQQQQQQQRHRLRRDRPTIKIRSQALKDNPALREYNERHEKTVGELLVEKFLIKDKQEQQQQQQQQPERGRMRLYHQASLLRPDAANDVISKEEDEDLLAAMRRRVTRRMTRRRSSADVLPLNQEQIEREAALLAAQAEALDSLVAEEQAEIEVEVRRGTFAKRQAMRLPLEISELSETDDDGDANDDSSKKHAITKKKKKRRKSEELESEDEEEEDDDDDDDEDEMVVLDIPESVMEEDEEAFEWDDRQKCDDLREIVPPGRDEVVIKINDVVAAKGGRVRAEMFNGFEKSGSDVKDTKGLTKGVAKVEVVRKEEVKQEPAPLLRRKLSLDIIDAKILETQKEIKDLICKEKRFPELKRREKMLKLDESKTTEAKTIVPEKKSESVIVAKKLEEKKVPEVKKTATEKKSDSTVVAQKLEEKKTPEVKTIIPEKKSDSTVVTSKLEEKKTPEVKTIIPEKKSDSTVVTSKLEEKKTPEAKTILPEKKSDTAAVAQKSEEKKAPETKTTILEKKKSDTAAVAQKSEEKKAPETKTTILEKKSDSTVVTSKLEEKKTPEAKTILPEKKSDTAAVAQKSEEKKAPETKTTILEKKSDTTAITSKLEDKKLDKIKKDEKSPTKSDPEPSKAKKEEKEEAKLKKATKPKSKDDDTKPKTTDKSIKRTKSAPQPDETDEDLVPRFKIEACNSVGDFSTLYVKAATPSSTTTEPPARKIEQYRESIRLPAPRKGTEIETEVVLPVRKPYVLDTSRNSVYLALKPSQPPQQATTIVTDESTTAKRKESPINEDDQDGSRPANRDALRRHHQSKPEIIDPLISRKQQQQQQPASSSSSSSSSASDGAAARAPVESTDNNQLAASVSSADANVITSARRVVARGKAEEFVAWWDETSDAEDKKSAKAPEPVKKKDSPEPEKKLADAVVDDKGRKKVEAKGVDEKPKAKAQLAPEVERSKVTAKAVEAPSDKAKPSSVPDKPAAKAVEVEKKQADKKEKDPISAVKKEPEEVKAKVVVETPKKLEPAPKPIEKSKSPAKEATTPSPVTQEVKSAVNKEVVEKPAEKVAEAKKEVKQAKPAEKPVAEVAKVEVKEKPSDKKVEAKKEVKEKPTDKKEKKPSSPSEDKPKLVEAKKQPKSGDKDKEKPKKAPSKDKSPARKPRSDSPRFDYSLPDIPEESVTSPTADSKTIVPLGVQAIVKPKTTIETTKNEDDHKNNKPLFAKDDLLSKKPSEPAKPATNKDERRKKVDAAAIMKIEKKILEDSDSPHQIRSSAIPDTSSPPPPPPPPSEQEEQKQSQQLIMHKQQQQQQPAESGKVGPMLLSAATKKKEPSAIAAAALAAAAAATGTEIDFWSEIKARQSSQVSGKPPQSLPDAEAQLSSRKSSLTLDLTKTGAGQEDELKTPLLPDEDEKTPLISQPATPAPENLSQVPEDNLRRDSIATLDDKKELDLERTGTVKKISKWTNLDNLSNLNDLADADITPLASKDASPQVSAPSSTTTKKKIVKKKKSSVSSNASKKSSDKSEPGSKAGTKKGTKKKAASKSGAGTSSASGSTLRTPMSAAGSPRNSPSQRPADLNKLFYTTPAILLTATPRDLRKVRRAKVKRKKPSTRTPSLSSDSTGSTRSTANTSTEEGSNCEEDAEQKRLASTRSNDSGFDGSPRLSNCDMVCHKKCEKLTGNLCGLNQKLVAEALQALKKGPSYTRTGRKSFVRRRLRPYGYVDPQQLQQPTTPSQSSENQRNADSDHFHHSGRITPPATNLPRFKKYEVTDFNFLKVLGKGSFGKVLLAELRNTECVYAVKCLKKDVVLEDDDVECTLIERKVLTLATRHPYLCHLFCTFQTESHLFFVMEYLNGGDLMFHIQKSGRFSEARARFYAAEIWSGLIFLHKKGIVYRDLKLDNVLLDFEGHIRIADFGMCKLQIFLDRTADTFCGTPDYMAPEIIKGLKYNQAVDWWSFGVLLYEMLTGQSPFSGCDEDELFWSICNERPFIPRYLCQSATELLVCLLEKDSGKRIPGHEIACHSFFNSIAWDKLERRTLEPPFKPAVEHTLDTRYFDTAFTTERPRLTPVPEQILTSMDQSVFRGFSYTNPNATD